MCLLPVAADFIFAGHVDAETKVPSGFFDGFHKKFAYFICYFRAGYCLRLVMDVCYLRIINTMNIPDSGKLTGIVDIQRFAALANAKSQQTVSPANTDVLENRRTGEEADTSTADRKKVAESKKDRHIGDDLEL